MVFINIQKNEMFDIEVPLNITANEFIISLNQGLQLGVNIDDVSQCYLSAENPIALLRGNKTLSEYGLHDGTIINFTR